MIRKLRDLKWRKNNFRRFKFEVRIILPGVYPDLDKNPTNPYNQLTDEERLKDFIKALAELLATNLKKGKGGDS